MATCKGAVVDRVQACAQSQVSFGCVGHGQVTLIPAAPEVSAASVDADAPRVLEVQGVSLFIDPWCAQPRLLNRQV